MGRLKSQIIRKNFVNLPNNNNQCTICNIILTGDNVTNMARHIEKKHPDVYEKIKIEKKLKKPGEKTADTKKIMENKQLPLIHKPIEDDDISIDSSQSTEFHDSSSSTNAIVPVSKNLPDPRSKKRKPNLEDKTLVDRCTQCLDAPKPKRNEIDVYVEYLENEIRSLSALDFLKFKKHVSDLLYDLKMASINTANTNAQQQLIISKQEYPTIEFLDKEGNSVEILDATK